METIDGMARAQGTRHVKEVVKMVLMRHLTAGVKLHFQTGDYVVVREPALAVPLCSSYSIEEAYSSTSASSGPLVNCLVKGTPT